MFTLRVSVERLNIWHNYDGNLHCYIWSLWNHYRIVSGFKDLFLELCHLLPDQVGLHHQLFIVFFKKQGPEVKLVFFDTLYPSKPQYFWLDRFYLA